MSTQPKILLTPEEYLAIERQAEFKSEFLGGEMFSMSGVSAAHNLIAQNLLISLRRQLHGQDRRSYIGEVRLRVPASGLYTYPDVMTVCGRQQFDDADVDTLLNPSFIAEVLSPTTEAYDRGKKFEHYRQIPTLREYLLVAQDRRHADVFTRQEDESWVLRAVSRSEDVIELPSVGCRIRLADLYQDVEPSAKR